MKKQSMILTICTFFLWINCVNAIQGTDSVAVKYSKYINREDLEKHLVILASDEYEGRETAKKGQKMAARYIADHFKSIGIKPLSDGTYYQVFNVVEQAPSGKMIIGDQSFSFIDDFYFFPGISDTVIEFDKVIFAGYGIASDNYNDYKNIDVKGKVVVILEGEPFDKKGRSLVTKKKGKSDWSANRRRKTTAAREQGVGCLLVLTVDYEKQIEQFGHFFEKPTMTLEMDSAQDDRDNRRLHSFFLSPESGNALLGAKKADSLKSVIAAAKKPVSSIIDVKGKIIIQRDRKILSTENVLGYIEGTDLKDELIIITAHYDHIGMEGDVVFNGADDDGSGTVALMEIAEAFQKASADGYRPRRSILIMPVSGEEKGLLGSYFYSENPVFPLEKTIANLNIDMIGRLDTFHHNNPDYVYLIGSDILSKELHEISEAANRKFTNIDLDYRYNDLNDPNRFYFRSDHYNFAKKNIPVIFYFNGVHADYHKSTDDVEKINFSKIEKITRLVFFTAWELANREERPKLNTE